MIGAYQLESEFPKLTWQKTEALLHYNNVLWNYWISLFKSRQSPKVEKQYSSATIFPG